MNYAKDKKKLLIINTIMQIAFCFFSIFFNIYVYEISNNFNIVICYTLAFFLTINVVFSIIRRHLTQKLISILYKISFVLCFLCILLSFLISKEHLYIAFIVQILYGITSLFYYMPSEVAAMYKNDFKQIKKFNGLNSTVAVLSAILSPLISGFVIDKISYSMLFAIIATCVILCLFFSHNINLTNYEVEHCKVKDMFMLFKQNKEIRYGYVGYGLKRFANDGPIEKILYILIFLKTGANYSVGIYSALAALIGGVFLILYVYCFKNSKIAFWLCSVFQFLSALLILTSNSLVCFFIYYFVKSIAHKVITNESASLTFAMINHTHLANNKIEHYYVINIFSTLGLLFACCLALLIYNFLHNVTAMTILIVIATTIQLLSSLFITKSRIIIENHYSALK